MMTKVALALACCMAMPPALADPFTVETIAENLSVPWAVDFAPDGRIFFTERGGTIKIIEGGTVTDTLVDLDVGYVEGGLLGIALDPDFADNGHVYAYYTYGDFFSVYNRVVRFTEEGGMLGGELVLIDGIPGGPIHDGGRIRFADDGTLYVTTGDAGDPGLAQNPDSLGGKILRINPDGTVPGDNPFEGSPVFSIGHRNPQGLDWDPQSGKLVISEHGPSGERGFAHDEINVVDAGGNYGWPDIVGDETGDGLRGPLLHSGTAVWAPSGAVFYDSDRIGEFAGRFLVATLAGSHLLAVEMDLSRGTVLGSERYLLGDYGRLRDVAVDGDGNVYVLTSNRDGRGIPAHNDDRILRISPVGAQPDLPGPAHGPPAPGAQGPYAPPLRQLETVQDPREILCNAGLTLVFRDSSGAPACVRIGSVAELVGRGWAAAAPG